MLVAISKEGELIYASEVKLKHPDLTEFYCPTCAQKVFYKDSHKGKGFFSHYSKCQSEESRMSPIESDEHKLGKEIIIQELQGIQKLVPQTELFFPEINQYADVYVASNSANTESVIYEFQRSVIPVADVRVRNLNYQQHVSQVQWLMDDYTTRKTAMNQRWKQTMLNYSDEWGFHLKFLNLKRKEIIIQHHLPIIYQKNKYKLKLNKMTIHEFHQRDSLPNEKDELISVRNRTQKPLNYHRQLNGIMNNEAYRNAIYLLYQEGTVLTDLPEWVFTEQWQVLLTQSASWLVFSWALTIVRQLNHSFTTDDFIEKFRACSEIKVAQTPLIHDDIYPILCLAILILLFQKGILEKGSNMEWFLK